MNFEELQESVVEWADERGILEIGDHASQFLKTVAEIGELSDAVAKSDLPEIVDGVGDVLVTLILFCEILEIDPVQCLESAYGEIRNRKGKMVGGVFVKD